MNLFNEAINNRYNEFEKYARFISSVSKKKLDYIPAISNAYIKALKHEPKTIEEAKGIIFHYIRCELTWTKTATEKERISAIELTIDIEKNDEIDNNIDLMYIVEKEVATWNFIDKVFFTKFMEFKLKKKKITDLAEYYSLDYAYCKEKISKLKKQIQCKI